jgi:XTP/dITP diphosphohydrolase
MRLLLATRNAHKLDELRALLSQTPIELLGLDDVFGLPDELPEDGATFEANAVQKATFVYRATGYTCCADDSGLEVDALGGRPGVHSRRFSPEGTDAANNAHLLALLGDTAERTARYRCALAVVGPGLRLGVDGACEGTIGLVPRGSNGFGYDPLFWPLDTPGRTMAELAPAEKNAISHRGRALRALIPRLLATTDDRL